jgi:23S rRNA (uracil1939-C5)-methyltransferase
MSKRRRRDVPAEPVDLEISGLSHDGRGVAELGGKKVFVHGALPGEQVRARLFARQRRYDEAQVVDVVRASSWRVQPRCAHFGVCGGCAMQHLDPAAQILAKQETLLQNLERIGKVTPDRVLEPLTGPCWHYRRRARLSVRYVDKKERLLIGFRERQGRYVAEMTECHVLDERIAKLLPELTAMVSSLEARAHVPQIEVACGDRQCALVFRHMVALTAGDQDILRDFALHCDVAVLLQPGGPESVHCLEPGQVWLDYTLPDYGLVLEFGPSDFIQVNAGLNEAMIARALRLLQPAASDVVLDLFCGLGNFTLPIARAAGSVVGVEGDAELVNKARNNALRNGIANVEFHVADLATDLARAGWLQQRYDKILIDPPRSGAGEMLGLIAATGANRMVYVSCHPASLARDAGILVSEYGFELSAAGVMDMFPHTAHVESIALFERK